MSSKLNNFVRNNYTLRNIDMSQKKLIQKTRNETLSLDDFHISRRKFIGGVVAGSLFATIDLQAINVSNHELLDKNQVRIVSSVQQILFPSDGDGPGAKDILADKYLLWVLSDEIMDPEEKDYIINGIGWIDETAEEEYSRNYNMLTQTQKEGLIDFVSREKWGRSWLGIILNFIFEALLSDKQYGGNPDNIGWKWLNYNGGNPRPTMKLLYPEIIKTIRNNHSSDE